jgi:RNA polymerase sigma-70 factor, ECF subfamily
MAIMPFQRRRNVLNFQPFDAAYLERLRLGDPETERNFSTYFSQLIRIKIRARVRSAQMAEDIRQETLLRAFRAVRSASGIHSPEGLGAFVNSVCNNVLMESLRGQKRDGTAPTVEGLDSADPTASPEERLIQQEKSGQVRRVLGGLAPRDRNLLSAVFLEERDKDEVCAQFGIGRDYLRVLLYRAKTQFRDLFVEQQSESRAAAGGEPRVQ